MKKLILLVPVLLLLGACAAKAPPKTQNNVVSIPIHLVNVKPSEPVIIPDQPSISKIVKITKGDDRDKALDYMIEYTKSLHAYAKNVTRQLVISDRENAVMQSKLKSIKRYLLIKQILGGGQPESVQPVLNY